MKKNILFTAAFLAGTIFPSYSQWWGIQNQLSQSTGGFKTSGSPVDNSVCVTGSFSGPTHNQAPHDQGGFVFKYDAQGNLKWKKIFYPGKYGIKTLNKTDGNGNIFVSGYCNGGMKFENDSFTKGGSYLMKYDMTGNLLFAMQDSNSFVNYMAIDGNNNIYLAGNAAMNRDSVFGKPFTKDYFLAKFDNNGNSVWVKYFYCPSTSNYDFELCIDAQGNIYSAGAFSAPGNITDSVQLISTGSYDGFVAKYNSDVELQWVKTIKGSATEVCSRIAVSPDGQVYVGGYIGDPPNYPSHYFDSITIGPAQMGDIFLAQYSNSGECQWVRTAGGNGSEFVKGIYVDDNGNSFITGFMGSLGDSAMFGSQTFHFPHGHVAVFLAQYDSKGNLIWVEGSHGGQGYANDVSGNGRGDLYITGGFLGNWNFGTVSLAGNEEMFLVKVNYASTSSSGNEVADQTESNFEIYPNPSPGIFTVSYSSKNQEGIICIYDVLGKCVLPQIGVKSGQQINLTGKPPGIYFVEVVVDAERRMRKIILE